MKLGIIFPGSGSSFVGMAKTFYDNERIVQEYFEEASNCLNQNFVKLCFASSEKELAETVNADTSTFLVSSSIYKLLEEKYGIAPQIVAGHGVGEYSALFAAGGINFPDGLYLLKKRGQFIEELTAYQNSGMLSISNFPEIYLRELILKYDDPASFDKTVQIVYFNSPFDFVVAGTLSELYDLKNDIEKQGGKASFLKISKAFNCRLMKEVEKTFTLYLEKVDFHELKVPVIENVEGKKIFTVQEIKTSLVRQIALPIMWWKSVQHFIDCDVIVEVGPGDKLSRLLSKEWLSKIIIPINEPSDVSQLIPLLKHKL